MNYTKAGMLNYLKEHISEINILPIMIVSSDEFFSDENSVINKIIGFAEECKCDKLIVRSSSTLEDTVKLSNAGKFDSILNVKPEPFHVKNAIEAVYKSYQTKEKEEVLIQPMLHDIKKSGVVFTADLETFASYYTVNYNEGDDTAAVTSGAGGKLCTFVKYKHYGDSISDCDMDNLIQACTRIEAFLQNDALDIEFAIDNAGEVFILQVRPIAKGNKIICANKNLAPALKRIYKKVSKLSRRHPFLLGETTCFGVMPDWNPAEILGVRPKKLAISLYKELITDNIWAHQRYDYGYRDLTMHPLMISFCGIPYIDTRITFNSFIPQKLNEKIAEKLVNYYISKLAKFPKYHDKIEFEIVFSCYYLGLPDKLKELKKNGFNENELTRIEFALLELTNDIISPQNGLYKKDIEKIKILETNYERILNSDISLVDQVYWLIEECKAYGTLPFAGVARAGFIAVQLLKSIVETGIITMDEYEAFMNSLDTVNKKMNSDLNKYYEGMMTKEEFLTMYGHIRPGTYDIMSKRYDEAFEEYFSGERGMREKKNVADFTFTDEQKKQIQAELDQNGILVNTDELIEFIKEAIEGREQLKFVFTKSVSKILQLVTELGTRVGISKEDMSYLDISVVKQLYVDLHTGDIKSLLEHNIAINKEQYESAIQIKLPSIIVNAEDVYAFYLLDEEPNYITQRSVTASVVKVSRENVDYEGKIVFIRAADPGYDFLFSKNIAGLVTQFGGANSHMAIRCAELGIPAIIGVGERNYEEWGKYKTITMDCQKKQIIRIE